MMMNMTFLETMGIWGIAMTLWVAAMLLTINKSMLKTFWEIQLVVMKQKMFAMQLIASMIGLAITYYYWETLRGYVIPSTMMFLAIATLYVSGAIWYKVKTRA